MNDNERKRFIQDIRIDKVTEYDEKKEFKKYERFINSSDFDDLRNVKVSPYRGDIER